jgi:hypothetical protein
MGVGTAVNVCCADAERVEMYAILCMFLQMTHTLR